MIKKSLLFSVVLSLILLTAGSLSAQTSQADSAAKALSRLENFSTTVREQVLLPENNPFSLAHVISRVASSPLALADFVKKRIALEPYFGILRGSAGTLAAGAGNDWDRAVLLHELLALAGYKSRFIIIERTEDEMKNAIEAFLQRKDSCDAFEFDQSVSEKDLPPPSAIFRQFGFDPGTRVLLAKKNAEYWRETLDQAGVMTAKSAAELENVLEKSGLQEIPDYEEWHGRLAGKVRQTVLIEILNDDQIKPLCLDPLISEIDKERLAEAEKNAEVPEELRAALTLRLILQTGKPDELQNQTILEHSQFAGNLFNQPIQLQIAPVFEHPEKKPAQTWSGQEWAANLAGFSSFQALLYLDDKVITSDIFDLSGKTSVKASDPTVDNASQIGNTAQGLWGSMMGGSDEDSEADSDSEPKVLEAILFEVEMMIPGEETILQRRILYGRLRKHVSPVCTIDLLVNESPIRPHVTAWMALEAFAANAPTLVSVIRSTDPQRFSNADGLKRFPQMLHNWLGGRIALAGRALRQNPDLVWLPGPACIMKAVSLKIASSAQEVTTEVALDVAFDLQTFVPRHKNAVKQAFSANIALGFAETALEAVLLGQKNPSAVIGGPVADWQAARTAGEPAKVFPADFSEEDMAENFTELARRAISEHESGKLVISSRPKKSRTWWSINPVTGRTLGRGDGGQGQAFTEYNKGLKASMDNLKCMLAVMKGQLQGKNPNSNAAGWIGCITQADNPGTYVGAAGGVMGLSRIKSTSEIGDVIAKVGDCLAGAWEVYQMAAE